MQGNGRGLKGVNRGAGSREYKRAFINFWVWWAGFLIVPVVLTTSCICQDSYNGSINYMFISCQSYLSNVVFKSTVLNQPVQGSSKFIQFFAIVHCYFERFDFFFNSPSLSLYKRSNLRATKCIGAVDKIQFGTSHHIWIKYFDLWYSFGRPWLRNQNWIQG